MDAGFQKDEECWAHLSENLDLLFARVADLNWNPHHLETQFDINMKIIEQMLKDQQLLAKQLEVTGNVVAQLSLPEAKALPSVVLGKHHTAKIDSAKSSLPNVFC